MNDTRAFLPLYRLTTAVAAGENVAGITVAAANGVSTPSAQFPGAASLNNYVQILVANKTSVWVHVSFGVLGAVRAATLNDFPVAPGAVVVASVLPEVNACAVYADGAPAASTSVLFLRGEGV